jgi:hypothetical protein
MMHTLQKKPTSDGLLCPGSCSPFTWFPFVQAWTEVDGFSLDFTTGLYIPWIDLLPYGPLQNNTIPWILNMAYLPNSHYGFCLDNLELLCFAHQFKRNLKRPLLELYWPLTEWTWPCKPQLVITKKVMLFLLSGLPMDDYES